MQLIKEQSDRGKAMFGGGSKASNVDILKRVIFTLDNILFKNDATDTDKIAAAKALYEKLCSARAFRII